MQEKTKKLVTIVMLVLALIGAGLAIAFAMSYDPKSMDPENHQGLYWSAYFMTVALAVVALCLIAAFYVIAIAKDRKKLVKTLIGLVIVVAVLVVLYLIAPANDVSQATMVKYDVTDGVSKFVSAATYVVYALVAAAALAIIYVECSKALKKK